MANNVYYIPTIFTDCIFQVFSMVENEFEINIKIRSKHNKNCRIEIKYAY